MTTNKFPDKTIELPEPWYWTDSDMVNQLNFEINDDHLLATKSVKTIARRQDNDDVLFEILNDEYKYAVVHLTWAQHKEISREYPRTKLYKTWNEVFDNRIMIDHKDFQD